MVTQLTPEDVEARINKLTRNEWIVVRFHCLGYSNVEIGRLLNRQPGGIGTWLFRACQKLGIRYNSDVERDAALNSFWAEELRRREPKELVLVNPPFKPDPEEEPIPEENVAWLQAILKNNLRPPPGADNESGEIIDGEWKLRPRAQLPPPSKKSPFLSAIVGALVMALALALVAAFLLQSGSLQQLFPPPPAQVVAVPETVVVKETVPFTVEKQVFVTQTVIATSVFTVTAPVNVLATTPQATQIPQPPVIQTVLVPVTATPAEVTVTPSPQASQLTATNNIPFAEPNNPGALSSDWKWNPGGSADSRSQVSEDGNAITVIAGRQTDFFRSSLTAPTLIYPVEGDIDAQIRLDFNPIEPYQVAGMVLRSRDKPGDWIGLRRLIGDYGAQYIEILKTQDNGSGAIATIWYGKTTAYLRIIRRRELLTFQVSENGKNWFTVKADQLFPLSDKAELVLHVYSTSSNGRTATFSGFKLGSPQVAAVPVRTGAISFTAVDKPTELDPYWAFFPGASRNSSYEIQNGKLLLTTGPSTVFERGSSPYVQLPVIGNLEAQVRLDFDPKQTVHLAGFGLKTGDDLANWVAMRRWQGDYGGQFINAQRMLNGGLGDLTSGVPYPQTTVYFRIRYVEPIVEMSYSPDGTNWTTAVTDQVMSFPEPAYLILFVWSSGDGVRATFSELTVTPMP
jgi:regulation of enolase protein 1 (concanavalin A-like superfamily)